VSDFQIVVDYPHPIEAVWRAVTDPGLVPRWTSEGLGARPEGFSPAVGTKFRFVAPPQPFWRGIVECEVIESEAPTLLRYTWVGDEGETPSIVTYRLAPHEGGTRFTYDHTGFTGVGGFVMSRVLRRVRTRMLRVGLRKLLDELHVSAGR
jgi:uncharacterized protein YndB with AHSA1/START domain